MTGSGPLPFGVSLAWWICYWLACDTEESVSRRGFSVARIPPFSDSLGWKCMICTMHEGEICVLLYNPSKDISLGWNPAALHNLVSYCGPDSLLIKCVLRDQQREQKWFSSCIHTLTSCVQCRIVFFFFFFSVLLNYRSSESSCNNGLWSVFPPSLSFRQWDQMSQAFRKKKHTKMDACFGCCCPSNPLCDAITTSLFYASLGVRK